MNYVGNSISQYPSTIDSRDVPQKPREVASLGQLYRVLLLVVEFVVPVAGGVDIEGIQGFYHLPTLFVSRQN